MYTAEFTQKGWAVFLNVNNTVERVTEPRRGDAGRIIAIETAIYLNDPKGE